MENVVLIIHLLLALGLIGIVLMQRSEGGGLGMGGGGGGVMSARSAATALGKVTWIMAICFIGTSIALTIIAAEQSGGASVADRLQPAPAASGEANDPALPDTDSLLPPPSSDEADGAATGENGAPLVPGAD